MCAIVTSNIPGVCSSSRLFFGSTNIGTSGLPPPTASNSIANLLLEKVSLIWMWSRMMSTCVEFSVCNICGTISEWSTVQNPRSWTSERNFKDAAYYKRGTKEARYTYISSGSRWSWAEVSHLTWDYFRMRRYVLPIYFLFNAVKYFTESFILPYLLIFLAVSW